MSDQDTRHPAARRCAFVLPVVVFAACGGGGGGASPAPGGMPDPEPPAAVSVSGTVSYEYVPPNPGCAGLNFDPAAIETRPIRGATVQLLDSAGSEVARTVAGEDGEFNFSGTEPNMTFTLRVRAELKKTTGASRWDVEVRDNVVDTSPTAPAPPPLGSRPLYVLDSGAFSSGNSGTRVDVTAETGWVGNAYLNARSAAPFAILDAIYTAMVFIEATDPGVVFAPLDAFWSVANTRNELSPAELEDLWDRGFDRIDSGNLGGSFYSIGLDRLFLTGDAETDTTEFDSHVIVHEWGHYFEDNLSRSDSPGGRHVLGDKLDARLAFGEGWAHALAAMALQNPVYCNTLQPGTRAGFGFNAEGGAFGGQGWYDEISVLRFIYDLWDTASEGTDTGSIGFGPIHETMLGPQAETLAWTTLFSFATELKAMLDATGAALLDAQLGDEQVLGDGINIWGDGETNAGGATEDVLPIHIPYTAGDPAINVCSNRQFDADGDGNKLSEFRYLRVAVPQDGQYDVRIASTTPTPRTADPDDRDQSDPDMIIRRGNTLIARLWSGAENLESTLVTEGGSGPLFLSQGTYAADLRDWRYADEEAALGYPDTVCFDVEFTLAP